MYRQNVRRPRATNVPCVSPGCLRQPCGGSARPPCTPTTDVVAVNNNGRPEAPAEGRHAALADGPMVLPRTWQTGTGPWRRLIRPSRPSVNYSREDVDSRSHADPKDPSHTRGTAVGPREPNIRLTTPGRSTRATRARKLRRTASQAPGKRPQVNPTGGRENSCSCGGAGSEGCTRRPLKVTAPNAQFTDISPDATVRAGQHSRTELCEKAPKENCEIRSLTSVKTGFRRM